MQNQHNTWRRPWWQLIVSCSLIVACPIIAALATYVISDHTVPVYKATTTLLVEQTVAGEDTTTEKIAHTYAEMLTAHPVLDMMIEKLALNETAKSLKARVAAEVIPDTYLIRLSVEDTDPIRAVVVADTIASEFVAQNQASDNVIIFEQAQVPAAPIRPRPVLNAALAGGVGMVLAIGFVVLFIVTTAMKDSQDHHELT